MLKYFVFIIIVIVAISSYGFYKFQNINNEVILLQVKNTELENRLDLISDALATNIEQVDRLETIVSKEGVN